MAPDPRDALSDPQRSELLEAALEFSDVLKARIAKTMADGYTVETKPDASLVTSADTDAEGAFRQAVIARFPAHGVKGEEFSVLNPEAEFMWVVDPIDGTAEFAAGLPLWGTIIGLYYRDYPLVGVIDHPLLQMRAWACHGAGAFLNGNAITLSDLPEGGFTGKERIGTPSPVNYARDGGDVAAFQRLCEAHPNLRIYHTCLAHVLAATGGLDAAIEWGVPLWDVAATRILVEEAGGRYRSLRRHTRDDGEEVFNVVFGRPRMVAALTDVLGG
jgi:fructose-1,6-bisphosphatase/inositol monophosphatase family enzyme